MKLHLPKKLTVALIAAVNAVGFTLPQSYAEIAWSGGHQDTFGYTRVFYMQNHANATLTDTDDDQFMITSDEYRAYPAAGEITSVVTKDGALMRISGGNDWGSDRILNPLLIDSVQAGDGSGTVNISTEQWDASRAASDTTVSILAVSGTVGSVKNYGVLTLGVDGTSSFDLTGPITNNAGTVTLNGTYTFDTSIAIRYVLKEECSVTWTDVANSQGFKKTSGSSYYAIKGATEGTNFSVTGLEKESSGNYYFTAGDVTDTTKFYVKADTAVLEDVSGTGESVVEKEGATLTVQNATYRDTSGSKNMNIVVGEGGVLEVTHSGGSGYVTGDITITGGGTFRVAGQHDAFGWGDTTTKSIILQGFDDSHIATLDLQQTSGNSVTMNAALKLMGNAAITGAKGFNTHDGSYYAEGTNNAIESFQIRHAATFEVKEGGELTVGSMTHGQDGNHILTKTGMGTMTFTAKAQANGLVINEGAIVIAGSEENSFYAITIGVSGTLKLTDSASLTMRGNLTSAGGALKLTAGASMHMDRFVSIEADQSVDAMIAGTLEVVNNDMHGVGGKGLLEKVSMKTSANYTIGDMSLSGSLIDVGEGTTLYLVNVDIKSDTHITDEAAWLDMKATNGWLDMDNTQVVREYTTEQNTTLFKSGDTGRSITLAAGTEIVELTSDMFDTVTMTGTDLWLDMTGIAEATYNKDYFTLDFKNLAHSLENAQVDVDHLHVYATLDGERYTEAYSTANGGLTTTLYFQVPEPTTGTLSLLALAALAARRRRK